MSLTQDASHGWLALRFSMCNDKLEHRSGAIGVFRIASLRQSHAVKILEATMTILRNFCEPTVRMPYSSSKRNLDLQVNSCSMTRMMPRNDDDDDDDDDFDGHDEN